VKGFYFFIDLYAVQDETFQNKLLQFDAFVMKIRHLSQSYSAWCAIWKLFWWFHM